MAFVRVKGPDGAEFTIDEVSVDRMGVTVLKDKDAVDYNGRVLAPKPATTLAGEPKPAKNKES